MIALDLLSRWLHVAGATFVTGSFLYLRFVLWPGSAALDAASRQSLWESASARLRPWANGAIVAVFASGIYNFTRVLAKEPASPYHALFGVKFLLALHVFSMLVVLSKPPTGDAANDAKRKRLAFGSALSALAIVAIGAYLRTLHA